MMRLGGIHQPRPPPAARRWRQEPPQQHGPTLIILQMDVSPGLQQHMDSGLITSVCTPMESGPTIFVPRVDVGPAFRRIYSTGVAPDLPPSTRGAPSCSRRQQCPPVQRRATTSPHCWSRRRVSDHGPPPLTSRPLQHQEPFCTLPELEPSAACVAAGDPPPTASSRPHGDPLLQVAYRIRSR